ncbi:conserved hypothetical protein [Hyphomicrobiales bacterium]|nr:conserved hypothetical protein [Hyphomicrobiales bacterium]CAH1697283.1 conserved hypothetical protein [Hyphomicrobiales bacterium]CAI0342850.1 conserved hypothetical protein [Hyphomicrobiales bacterium]
MREIAIRCPGTGLPVGTGEKTAGKIAPRELMSLLRVCPACGGSHKWDHRDAWLIDVVSDDTPDDDSDSELL